MDGIAAQSGNQVAALPELAEQINFEHGQAEAALNDGLDHALAAGALLAKAKELCRHGTWLPWLTKNFKGSKRTAQAYLRLHREFPKLKRKAPRVALLSMRQALVNLANDTQIVARSDDPAEIIRTWEKEQCPNARRAAARAEVHRSTRTIPLKVRPPEPEYHGPARCGNCKSPLENDQDEYCPRCTEGMLTIEKCAAIVPRPSDQQVADMFGVTVENMTKARAILKRDPELAAKMESGEITLDEATSSMKNNEPPLDFSGYMNEALEIALRQFDPSNAVIVAWLENKAMQFKD